jgi:type II secretory pathway pseudopilin PulG
MVGAGHKARGARRNDRGVTLVELIAFIAISGIVAAALVQVFSATMHGAHYGKEVTQATQLAQQRMDVILGQRARLGYAGFTVTTYDPCPPVGTWATAPCNTTTYPAGSYTVSSSGSSFAADACGAGTGTNCRLIVVTVAGPYGDPLASLTAQFWNYAP